MASAALVESSRDAEPFPPSSLLHIVVRDGWVEREAGFGRGVTMESPPPGQNPCNANRYISYHCAIATLVVFGKKKVRMRKITLHVHTIVLFIFFLSFRR